ncbi:MAG: PQQ-like beta-propeller repeat protein [Phycisphaerae bacterium]|nr:PQQ-like beta-propeller repeat protein [Phycisphaerae bacterium]
MRNLNLSKAVTVCCVFLVASTCIFAQDWPQWRGPNRDGEVSGFAAPSKWPSALGQKWKTTVGSGDGTPALVGEKLYVFTRQGGDEVTLCLNAANGNEIWRDKYAAQAVTGPASRHPGPRSSPAVANGKVVTLGVAGVVSCLDVGSGKMLWRKDPYPKVVPTFFTSCSPIIVGGAAVAQLGKAGNGAIIAFDLATGSEKWKWAEEGAEYASPAVLTVDGTEQIVTLTEKSIVGVGAADGKLLWKLPFAPGRRAYNAATPIVEGQTVIYTGAGRGAKAVKIEKQGDGFVAKELWSNPDLAPQYNTPVLKNGLLFGFSGGGNLYCINAKDGSTAWTDTAQHGRGFAAIVSAGSAMLALPSTSELIVYKPDGKAYAEIAKYKVAETPIYAHPVISGKRIFVKDQDSVAMWTIE